MILDGAAMSREMFGRELSPREHLVQCYPKMADVVPPLDHVVLTAVPLVARVNHGQWVASCDCGAPSKVPTPGGVVFLDRPLIWCVRCQNGSTGRGWRRAVVPIPATRQQIETVLMLRPNVGDRNWEPSETVDDLIAQNREHGDPVPDLAGPLIGPDQGPDWRELVAPFGPLPQAADRAVRRLLRRLAGRR